MRVETFDPSRLDPALAARRRFVVATLLLIATGPAMSVMADLHWRTGFDCWKILHLGIFSLLFVLVALGAVQAAIGYVVRRRGEPCSILRSVDFAVDTGVLDARTAVVMPICNEEVRRVIAGLRAAYESVQESGQLSACDFFLLSDSTDPNRWIEEEAAWLALTQQLGATGRIFYRKRRVGLNKKAGNIADFCRRWGRHYRYMVVLDADSIISGRAIAKLVRLMERNRGVGLIQAAPLLANGETILARLQQFASRLYGPAAAAGLNFWQLSESNYWGHNAIVRLNPFMRHCSLPELPGDGPFGGRIMSHDYVEAALMRRAGWQVWLAANLEENYEECPANVLDLAKRDRRWLQGNLQHTRLIVARGFHPVNRVHFILGILSYLASPLWLALLALSAIIAADNARLNPAVYASLGFARHLHWSLAGESLILFFYTLGLLLLPKLIALLELRERPDDLAAFGGWGAVWKGLGLETGIFTLLAPVLMLFHTQFIVLTLCRQPISWGTQRRGREGAAAWSEAIRGHAGHTAVGLIAAACVWSIDPRLAAWMSPVLLGLIFSIPLSYLTGSLEAGMALRRAGIFLTPEETNPPEVLERISRSAAEVTLAPRPVPAPLLSDYGLLQAVLDPYVNAVHVALLREKEEQPLASEERFDALRAQLICGGPGALPLRDKVSLLLDPDSMRLLHDEVWAAPAERLDPWWRQAIRHYSMVAPAPETPFDRAAA
ncbi:MAG TPA: glucans biosynthesis glucosyltransferase MdoH [Opitutaceae bacterium]|jgi:membrane glycosyltransferase|nr:glucans biosynthesis glucosyltransferase MdoH [Opitutaceae bacterium]